MPPVSTQVIVRAERGSSQFPDGLQRALPMKTGDLVRAEAEIPKTLTPVLIWIKPNGVVSLHSNFKKVPDEGHLTTLIWPFEESTGLTGSEKLKDPGGTDIFIIVAAESIDDDRRSRLVAACNKLFNEKGRLPQLPEKLMYRFDLVGIPEAIIRQGDTASPRGITVTNLNRVHTRILELQAALSQEKWCEFVLGEAFPHIGTAPGR